MKPAPSTLALTLSLALTAFGAQAQTSTAPSTTPSPGTATSSSASSTAAPVAGPSTAPATAPSTESTAPGSANTQSSQSAIQGTLDNNASQNDQSTLADEDERFMENAIQGSHAEIVGSQLALEKTESADVRDFAQHMIKDHGQMLKEAETLAEKKGMTPPDGPSVMQTTEITALRALTGGAFDAMYVNRIGVASHEATVEMFEKASQEAQDPEVKAMATKTLPKLREHLEMARALDKKQDQQ